MSSTVALYTSMSYFRICSMRSIKKPLFVALLKKILDFGGQLADKFSYDQSFL